MNLPTPDVVRADLARLDTRQQKIAVGLFGVLVSEPTRARDKEWVSEQLTQLTVLSEDDAPDDPQAAVQAVQVYLEDHANLLLEATFLLFQRVGADLAPKSARGFTFDQAMQLALGYLPDA
tara:strand:- start:4553 stop:4915 length:363 start_codon:yes stop_codon:yes gene_type:complete